MKCFKKLAQQGYTEAEFFLGLYYAEGYAVEKNIAESVKWYEKSAQQGG